MATRVLLVDDSRTTRKLLAAHLAGAAGYEIIEAASVEACFAALRDGTYDAILLDYVLPDAEGLEPLRRLRREYPELPVVMITSYGNINLAVDAMREGAADFVQKDAALLDRAVASVSGAIARARLARLERLEAQQRTWQEAVTLAARTAAHEISQPLAIVVGVADMLADRKDLPEATRKHLATLTAAAESAAAAARRLGQVLQPVIKEWAGGIQTIDLDERPPGGPARGQPEGSA